MHQRSSIVLLALALGCGGASSQARTEEARRDPPPEAHASETGSESTTGEDAVAVTEEPAVEQRTAPLVPAHGPLSEDDLRRGLFSRLADPRFPSCTVSALSPALRRRTTEVVLPTDLAMTLPERTVSAGRAEGREVAVYLSPRLDPSTPLADLGYRVRLRGASGEEEDLSLGLSAMRPFVLVHNPMLALIEDGALALEADVRELDDAASEQREGGARYRRQAREALVRCELADLRRDQDGDGLTDLEEERLLTDAWDRDTDGDGRSDSEDRSPLGSAAASTDQERAWLAAIEQLVAPELGEGLAVMVRGGARLDVPASITGRVLVLREDELSAYQRRFGRRPPLVLSVAMRGADRAEVTADFVWRSRTFDGTRDASGAWSFAEHTTRRR